MLHSTCSRKDHLGYRSNESAKRNFAGVTAFEGCGLLLLQTGLNWPLGSISSMYCRPFPMIPKYCDVATASLFCMNGLNSICNTRTRIETLEHSIGARSRTPQPLNSVMYVDDGIPCMMQTPPLSNKTRKQKELLSFLDSRRVSLPFAAQRCWRLNNILR